VNINLTGFGDEMQVPPVCRRASHAIIETCVRLAKKRAATENKIDNLSDFFACPHQTIRTTR